MAPKKDYSFLELNQGTDWSKDNKNRVLFCAINVSGYYSLAIRLLCLLVADISELRSKFSFRYVEWTDIDELDEWYSQIEQWQPDLLCVSINVWSRDLLFRFAANLKKRLPGMTILAGGQELTYSAEDYLIQNPALDYIIDGEGELAIQEFLNAWNVTTGRIKDHNNVSGLHYRQDGKSVNSGPVNYINNLNENPSPILAGLVPVEDKDKLGVLIEATRGCPFHCSYCFEGARNNTIRTVSLHRIKQEVEVMASKGARYFHMLDPILCNSRVDRLKYLYEMFSVLQRKYGYLDISVEAYADQISEEVAGYLDMCSIVDIGLQSTNPKTVQEIHRSFNEDKFCQGITWLQQTRANINIYLILGLPYETIHSFFNGLLFVIRCNPTQIFVNELCVLNGTELRHRAAEYQYSFNTTPPYLAQSNAWLSSTQMLLLRQLANTMKNRYNMNCYLKLNNLPWFKHGNIDFGDSLHLLFNSSTSCECIDSTFIDCSKFKGSNALDSLLDVVQGKNVKLTITNNVDIPALKKIASMVQMAGPSMISFYAPLSFFTVEGTIQTLLNLGIWYFRVSLPIFDELTLEMVEEICILKNKYPVNDELSITPFIEIDVPVIIQCFQQNIDLFQRLVNTADVISIGDFPDTIDEIATVWPVIFHTVLDNNCWPEVSHRVMEYFLENEEKKEEVLNQMERFSLLKKVDQLNTK